MRPWQRAALGAVQGVAEAYPVSSSAQLTLLPWLLRWPAPQERTSFAAGLHAGSALGVLLALREDVLALDARGAGRLLATGGPAAVAGMLLQGPVERRLGRPLPTAVLLAVAGAILALADSRPQVRGRNGAGAAALAQVAALAPGVSRSGAVLTALRLRGIPREEALRTSLLMSLPVTVGAALLTSARSRRTPPVVPSALAALTAYAATRHRPSAERVVRGAVLYRLAVAAAVVARAHKEHR